MIREGDLVYLRLTAGSSQDVTIRDVTTTAAATHGFQLPGNTSVVLLATNDVMCFLFGGTHWHLVSTSING